MTLANFRVPYSYLRQQFQPDGELARDILRGIEEELKYGRFTLGPAVEEFEAAFASACGARYAVGVASGTDALALAIRVVTGGTPLHWSVVTVPNSFVATVGAI